MTAPKKQPSTNSREHGARLIEFFALAHSVEQHPDETLLTEQVRQAITAAARELARLDPVYKRALDQPLPVGVEIFDVAAAERQIFAKLGSARSEAKAEAARVNGAATRFAPKHETPEAAAAAHRASKRESARRRRAGSAEAPAKRGRPKKTE